MDQARTLHLVMDARLEALARKPVSV